MKSSNDEEAPSSEPIAIVGIGCRFPGGVRDLASFGKVLSAGNDLMREVPADRWSHEFHDPRQAKPGTTRSHIGAFLDDIDRFDAAFFGISPREAASLDPQHRLLLETAWEAMCDAGRPLASWRGSQTAVFIGMLAGDYATLHAKTVGVAGIGPHYATGIEFSFAAGRLAYAFDLHGPAATLNSACSSSLLAVHLGAQALRSRECDAALVGGVNLLVTPELSVFMSGIGATSPSGSCRPFDIAADGVVRGEGCGVVVLRRLADALADGDRVYAVILGSAVNHDGSSLGLTAPNATAQAAVVQAALAHAGIGPADVDYVEAHGTGTPLGDRIELQTLAEVYGAAHSPRQPLLVGSHKAVYGHTDAAAGIAGLLKAVWVTRKRHAPGQPRLTGVIPVIDWEQAGIAVPAADAVIEAAGRPVRAGVSAFGLSGTNAHVIVAGAVATAQQADPAPPVPGPYLLLLSASRRDGLAEQAGRMQRLIANTVTSHGAFTDLVASAATRRTHEMHRCAVAAAGPTELIADLADFGNGQAATVTGTVDADVAPAPVFVYSGQGCQWAGMATDLYGTVPEIRESLDECDALIRQHVAWSLIDELRRTDDSRLGRTDVAQPAIFAVQRAISGWLMRRGVRPAAVLGHSVGEVTAAHVAGCLTVADAVRLAVLRGQVLEETAGAGRMVAVDTDVDTVNEVLSRLRSPVAVAAVNGPRSVVLAGPPEDLVDATHALHGHGLRCVPLPVNYAFHSTVVAHCGPQLRDLVAHLTPASPTIRLLSSAAPARDVTRPDAAHWEQNLICPVLLWPAVDRLLTELAAALIEVSPHPVLIRPLTDALRERGRAGPVVASLRRGEDGSLALLKVLGSLHVAGVGIDWEQVTGRPREFRTLPLPSWGGDRYWLPGVQRGQQRNAAAGVPVGARVSLLDADWQVISEMIAEPHGARVTAATSAPPVSAGNTSPVAALEPAGYQPHTSQSAGSTPAASVRSRVGAVARQVLGLSPDQPLPRLRGLFELGLDSVTALELKARLETEFSVTLSTTVVFEHATVEQLCAHLVELGMADSDHQPTSRQSSGGPPSGNSDAARGAGADVAVIGLACRLPGAPSAQDYWTLLTEGRDAIRALPADRLCDPVWAEIGADVPTHAGYLDDVTQFDAPFFHISPREARSLDPQQRLFLEVACEALADAGQPAPAIRDTDVGVYLGLNTADYQQLLTREMGNIDLYYGTGTSFAAAAGRLSYFLGLQGPSMAVDTACSASLTAVHLACQGLRSGDCQLAVVGGANVIVAPTVSASMCAGGALAPDGRCKTFDEAADGYGRGEGAVALVLKPLATARRDRDRVYAVIQASAVNQDGSSGGLTVPSPAAQVSVIRAGLRRCGWAPHEIDYVEAHGTGTALGDPLEVQALAEALGPGRTPQTRLLLGSVKANIGHLEAAAGAAGLLKVILALHHDEIPPHRVSRPSRKIDWAGLPVALATARQSWPARGRLSRAGVSAFGFSGSNAHVLVEQAPAVPEPASTEPALPYSLVVTAGSDAALRAAAGRMAAMLLTASSGELAAIVYTAACRRTWLDHRVMATGNDAAELAAALDAVAAGQPHPSARLGVVTDASDDLFAAECAAVAQYAERAGLRPVSLPAYPWERRRHWYRDNLATAVQAKATDDDRWFLTRWERVEPPRESTAGSSEWVVIGDSPLAADLVKALEKRDHAVRRIDDGGPNGERGDGRLATWRRRLGSVSGAHPSCRGIVLICPGDTAATQEPPSAGLLDAIAIGKAMAALPQAPGRLWLVTTGAHDPTGDGEVNPAHSALWEVGRVLAMELPSRWGGLIDTVADADAEAIARALNAENPDDQVCVRDNVWYAARLTRQEQPQPCRAEVAKDRWHVVLGGPAAGPVVGALLGCGARRVLLAGAVAEPQTQAEVPAGVTWRRCSAGELDDTLATLGPIGDVVAVAAPGTTIGLADVTAGDISDRLDESVRLTRLCAVACRHQPQRLTVVTTAAPSWGSVNTAASAGAAGWLAGWAQRAGQPMSLLSLMPRADTGELAVDHQALFEQSGLRLLSAAEAEETLRLSLLGEPAERSVALVDLRRYVRLCQDLAPRAFLSNLAYVGRPAAGEFRARLLALPRSRIEDTLLSHVSGVVAEALGMALAELDPGRGFFDLGLDSVMALSVRSRLEDDLGLELSSTLTFEYTTSLQLADYLHSLLPSTRSGEVELLAELADEMAQAERALARATESGHGSPGS